MSQPLLIMFVGVPGSGKTTFAKQYAGKEGGVVLNSDALRLSMWGSREAIQATHATQEERNYTNSLTFGAMDYAAGQIVAAGHSVIYDCNANHKSERQKTRRVAGMQHCLSIVVRIRTPRDVAIQRGLDRDESHDQRKFTPEKAEEIVDRFTREIEEPTADENVIEISGEQPFDEQYRSFQQQLATLAQQ